jgi:hypothetical protein
MHTRTGILVALLALLLAAAAPVRAEDTEAGCDWLTLREWGMQFGAGDSFRGTVQHYALQPYVGLKLYDPVDRWLTEHGMRGTWMIEPWVAFVSDREGNAQDRSASFEIGVSPIFFRLAFGEGEVRPFIEGGLGLVYTDLRSRVRHSDLGQRMQFSEQGGFGVEWAFQPDYAFTLSGRYRHISNAGFDENNPGLDTVYGVVGLVFR